jgi:hypothetical protein
MLNGYVFGSVQFTSVIFSAENEKLMKNRSGLRITKRSETVVFGNNLRYSFQTLKK